MEVRGLHSLWNSNPEGAWGCYQPSSDLSAPGPCAGRACVHTAEAREVKRALSELQRAGNTVFPCSFPKGEALCLRHSQSWEGAGGGGGTGRAVQVLFSSRRPDLGQASPSRPRAAPPPQPQLHSRWSQAPCILWEVGPVGPQRTGGGLRSRSLLQETVWSGGAGLRHLLKALLGLL